MSPAGLFALVVTRRFPRDVQAFGRKYAAFDGALRAFCRFRVAASPSDPFNGKDGRMAGPLTRLRRCHLVHGKAIVLYAIIGQTVRLIAVLEHDGIEGRAAHEVAAYVRSLGEGDFEPALISIEDSEAVAGARCRAPSRHAFRPLAPRCLPGATLACGGCGSYAG